MEKDQKKQNDSEPDESMIKIIADIETCHLVGSEIQSSAVLNMNDINYAYNEFLNDQLIKK